MPSRIVRADNRPYVREFDDMKDIYAAQASYRPRGYGMSEGFRRARQPYLVRNLLLIALMSGMVTGVYFYSIIAVSKCSCDTH